MPQWHSSEFSVNGNRYRIVTQTKSQTIRRCKPSNKFGDYDSDQFRIQDRLKFVVPRDFAAMKTCDEVADWLLRCRGAVREP